MEGSKYIQPQAYQEMEVTRGQWVLLEEDTVHPQAVMPRKEGRVWMDFRLVWFAPFHRV